jgi:hypothetical protein
VTICIAAICRLPDNRRIVVGATDRMLTAGDIQFEPPKSKVFRLTQSTIALLAGDSGPQDEICSRLLEQLTFDAPERVRKVVDAYCLQLSHYNRQQAEKTVLAPFGLTIRSFLKLQRELDPEFVNDISIRLGRSRALIQTIIAGTDSTGAHIYTVNSDGESYCHNATGFVAIGDGEWHAQSQFMFAGYISDWSFPRSILLTYGAKKRAEVAPGVGQATDMFYQSQARFEFLGPHVMDKLDEVYNAMRHEYSVAVENANDWMEQFVQQLVPPDPQSHQPQTDSDTPESDPPQSQTEPETTPVHSEEQDGSVIADSGEDAEEPR